MRAAPVGTIAQPSLDHSSTGTLCWVTGNSVPGNPPDNNDVDAGTTTLLSPAWDLSAHLKGVPEATAFLIFPVVARRARPPGGGR